MKKTILYILLQFSSAALADWITVEHDFKMCDQDVPSKRAAVHINDDGIAYSSSLLVKDIQTVDHKLPSTTVNVTMWGCTYDCQFSFMLKVNKDDHSVSSFTNQKEDNYFCNLSKSTSKLIPTPKITYQKELPNPDYIFPTHLTAMYCSEGKHPDAPNFQIKQTENVAECIDELTGNNVGTYAASLQFGSGSSFKPDGYGIATYNMINSANKLFDYWESHHRGLHDSLNELSLKAAELSKLKPPTSKSNVLKNIVPMVAGIAPLAVPITVGINDVINDVVNEITEPSFTKISELAAEIGAADDVIASAKGTAKNAAVEWRDAAMKSKVAQIANSLDKGCDQTSSCLNLYTQKSTIEYIAELYGKSENPNLGKILAALNKLDDGITKRDTVDDLGFFTTNMMNLYYLPSLMDRVHQSMNDSDYSDVSSFLSAASTKLLSQFEDTLHNNFFTGNKSLLDSFTANQVVNHDQILANYDDVYKTIKNGTYDNMAVSIISANVEICDPKPSFCGQSCNDGLGVIYCPTIGKDSCITTASDSQIMEFNLLRDTSDICSNDKSTGWNITHNPHCDIKQFQCLSLPKNHKN